MDNDRADLLVETPYGAPTAVLAREEDEISESRPPDAASAVAGPPAGLQVMQMIMAAGPSRTLVALADLGIPDAIGPGRRTAAEVAGAINGHEPWVLRPMRAAASVGVLRYHDDGTFGNTALGDALRSDTPNSVRAMAVVLDQPFHFLAWAGLAEGVRSGKVPFERVHQQTFFEYLRTHPRQTRRSRRG